MILSNFIKKSNQDTKVLFLNLLVFIVGFSIPFSSAFNSICIGILFLYSFIWFKKSNFNALFQKGFRIHVLFLAYFLIQFVGVFYSDDIHEGFDNLIQNIVFLIVPLTFIHLYKCVDKNTIRLGVFGLVASVILILLSIYINIYYTIVTQNLELNSLLYHFVRENFVEAGLAHIHPPYFGLMVVFAMAAVFQTAFSEKKLLNRTIKYSILFLLLVSLYGISSFMSFILLFVVYVIFLYNRKTKIALFAIFIPILLAIMLVGSIKYTALSDQFPGESLLGRIEWSFIKEKGDTSRPQNWKSVLLVIKNHPIIGVGTYGGLNYLQAYRSKTSESFINEHNAHNQYLETLLRHGIVGLIIYLIMLYNLILGAINSRDLVFGSFVLIFSVASLTESYLMRQIGLTFFIFYALLFSTHYNIIQFKKYPK